MQARDHHNTWSSWHDAVPFNGFGIFKLSLGKSPSSSGNVWESKGKAAGPSAVLLDKFEIWEGVVVSVEVVAMIVTGLGDGRVVGKGWAAFVVVFNEGLKTCGSRALQFIGHIPVFLNAEWIISLLKAHSQAAEYCSSRLYFVLWMTPFLSYDPFLLLLLLLLYPKPLLDFY